VLTACRRRSPRCGGGAQELFLNLGYVAAVDIKVVLSVINLLAPNTVYIRGVLICEQRLQRTGKPFDRVEMRWQSHVKRLG
jgi:hypothetical protein